MQIQATQHEKIIQGFDHDPDKFLGEFPFNGHLLTRSYLVGEGINKLLIQDHNFDYIIQK